jgi:hypothetical protein
VGRSLAVLIAGVLLAVAPAPAGAGIVPGEDVFNFGDAPFLGSTGKLALNAPLVGMAPTPSGNGYWLLARDGGVFSFGDATFHGSTGNLKLNQPVVGLAADPGDRGYWFVAGDGGIFAFHVPFLGSMGAVPLNQPVVGMAPSKTGEGYWLVARDGGIFAFGDAKFAGSTGAIRLNQPIVAMAADPDGTGYWFVAADGGVFAFDAPFLGAGTGSLTSNDRVIGMAAHPGGKGYWLATAKGSVLNFGEAASLGNAADSRRSMAAVAAHPSGKGYWLAVNRASPRPAPAVLQGPQDAIRATLGTYCWAEPGGTPLCADTFGFPTGTSILNVRRGERVTVRWEALDIPLDARVFRVDAPATDASSVKEMTPANPATFVADFPVGLHRMGLSTGWAQGGATYHFQLNVR